MERLIFEGAYIRNRKCYETSYSSADKNWFLTKLQNITMNRINFNSLGTESKLTTRTKREQHKTQNQTFSLEVHICSPIMILWSDASCFIVKNRKS